MNSSQRKHYILYGQTIETNVNLINYFEIKNINSIENFLGYFPNVNKLTLSNTIDMPRNFILHSFNRIISLKQITKLILHCHHLLFEQILQLLSYTINVQTLEFDSLLLNRIKNVTIRKEIILDKIKLCILLLLSQMESLTINLHKIDLESIVRFILRESNLSLLCISKQRRDFFEPVKYLIDSEELIRNYTIELINRKVYLW
ncbi:unnamed protein product, partial [Adineta steineri]